MKDSLATTVDIKQKFSLKKDIAQVEKEIEELINQIKNTQ
jgi:hypothetical protein